MAKVLEEEWGQIAAIIVEPIAGNMGVVPPRPGFLQGLRDLCDSYSVVLIFDEVISGFRVALGGAQELFGVTPDLTTLGKIIGGGFPVGAFGGKREIMEAHAPLGPVYQAGTLSGNPVAMVAGLALIVVTLRRARLTGLARRTDAAVRDFCVAEAANVDAQIRLLRSVGWWYLGPVISGVNLFFFGMRGPTLDTLGYFAGTLLLAVFIYRLNVRAVTRRLEPMRSQLLAILEQMPKTEEADQNRRDD